jgi:hypothetical protein
MACRIPHVPELAGKGPEGSKATIFSIPAKIDAHQTVAGWVFFALAKSIIEGKTIDTHRILLEDSHGLTVETEPISVREWIDEEAQR